jgi:membrane protein DedA with SNARE-associated domain/rhodanese-related sulfurtransferase
MDPFDLLADWGVALIAVSMIAAQAGLPIPEEPILVAAGGLARDGTLDLAAVLAAAILSCLLVDHAWFIAGRWRGRRMLAGLCRISISPDTCVRRTDDLIIRYGEPLLVVAKFIPGISLLAIPTAAAMGIPYRRFLAYDLAGCVIWCGSLAALGWVFSREVHSLIALIERFGTHAVVVLGLLLAAYIGWKVAHRMRLRRLFRLVRVAPDEVARLIAEQGSDVVILDARSRLARVEDPRAFPGSIAIESHEEIEGLPPETRTKTVVTFCTCPNEASAALLAERLLASGYSRVRVLTGGTEALTVLAV